MLLKGKRYDDMAFTRDSSTFLSTARPWECMSGLQSVTFQKISRKDTARKIPKIVEIFNVCGASSNGIESVF